jgi:chorismate-pyruvate lyase
MPALDHLVSLFYSNIAELGAFEEVLAEAVPEPYRRLLAHHEHMTVAVERYHGSPVDVKVLETQQSGDYYSRKIVLHRQSDRRIVLFGIPRLNLRLVDESVRREILSENKPLGRVLIDHNVLREVQLASLYRLVPGPDLCQLFGLRTPLATYGRTAFIYCDGFPAVELLEIVPPEPASLSLA